jgi:hypothetical protein
MNHPEAVFLTGLTLPPDDEVEVVTALHLVLLQKCSAQEDVLFRYLLDPRSTIDWLRDRLGLSSDAVCRLLAEFQSNARAFCHHRQPPHGAD